MSERSELIRIAANLPKGSGDRRIVLAALKESRGGPLNPREWREADEVRRNEMLREQMERVTTILQLLDIMAGAVRHPQARAITDMKNKSERLEMDLN